MVAAYGGIVVVDRNGIIASISQQHFDFWGKIEQEGIGRPIGEIISYHHDV